MTHSLFEEAATSSTTVPTVRFIVRAVPVAQPRQRHRIVQGAGRAFVANYTPTKHPANAFKAAVQWAASQAWCGAPLEGPLALSLLLVLPRPQAMCWKKRPTPRAFHTGRPDCENVAKGIMDALNKLLWKDDSQISDLRVCKFIAAGDEAPHAEVRITAL